MSELNLDALLACYTLLRDRPDLLPPFVITHIDQLAARIRELEDDNQSLADENGRLLATVWKY